MEKRNTGAEQTKINAMYALYKTRNNWNSDQDENYAEYMLQCHGNFKRAFAFDLEVVKDMDPFLWVVLCYEYGTNAINTFLHFFPDMIDDSLYWEMAFAAVDGGKVTRMDEINFARISRYLASFEDMEVEKLNAVFTDFCQTAAKATISNKVIFFYDENCKEATDAYVDALIEKITHTVYGENALLRLVGIMNRYKGLEGGYYDRIWDNMKLAVISSVKGEQLAERKTLWDIDNIYPIETMTPEHVVIGQMLDEIIDEVNTANWSLKHIVALYRSADRYGVCFTDQRFVKVFERYSKSIKTWVIQYTKDLVFTVNYLYKNKMISYDTVRTIFARVNNDIVEYDSDEKEYRYIDKKIHKAVKKHNKKRNGTSWFKIKGNGNDV